MSFLDQSCKRKRMAKGALTGMKGGFNISLPTAGLDLLAWDLRMLIEYIYRGVYRISGLITQGGRGTRSMPSGRKI